MKHLIRLYLLILLMALLITTSTPTYAQLGLTTRLMVSGNEFNTGASFPSISNDGRYIVFESDSTNVVANDTNSATDIFRYDTQTATYTRVSVSSANVQGNGNSTMPIISGNGRYVVFWSDANNLTANDSNGYSDVFLRDMQTNTTTLISVNSTGNPLTNTVIITPDDISSDGRYVVMVSDSSEIVPNDTNNSWDIFLYDRQTGTTSRVSVNGNGDQLEFGAVDGKLSDDGRYLAFSSSSSNLVANDTNNAPDAFIKDLQTGQVTRVSVDSSGNQATYLPAMPFPGPFPFLIVDDISADGRYVTFASNATNLVANDTNEYVWDQFFHDSQTGQTKRISINNDGTQADDLSGGGVISDDGRYVFFESGATTLVANDTNNAFDVFMFDNQTNSLSRISLTSAGGQTDGDSGLVALSANMRYVVIASFATNIDSLGWNDTNGAIDIFIYDSQVQLLPAVTLRSPANLFETDITTVIFAWNSVASATRYRLQVATDPLFTDIVHEEYVVSATSVSVTFVSNFGVRYWRVQARTASSYGPWSEIRQFSILYPAPTLSSPTDGRVFNLSGYSNISFSWLYNYITPMPNYQIQISRDMGFNTIIVNQITTNRNYTYMFTEYGRYYWRVRGLNTVNTAWSTIYTLYFDSKPLAYGTTTRIPWPYCFNYFEDDNTLVNVSTTSIMKYDIPTDTTTYQLSSLSIASIPNAVSYQIKTATPNLRYLLLDVVVSQTVVPSVVNRVYRYDTQTSTFLFVSPQANGIPSQYNTNALDISDDGNYVTYEGIAQNFVPPGPDRRPDVYIYHIPTGQVNLVSDKFDNQMRVPGGLISPNNRYVAHVYIPLEEYFWNSSYGELYLYDTQTGQSSPVLRPDNTAVKASIYYIHFTNDGRFIVLSSKDNNLVAGDTNNMSDVFFYDLQTRAIERISTNTEAVWGNADSFLTSISPDGRYVAFSSFANNFISNDTNNLSDAFVRDRQTQTTRHFSINSGGQQINSGSTGAPGIMNALVSPSGKYLLFCSNASNMSANGFGGAFLHVPWVSMPTITSNPVSSTLSHQFTWSPINTVTNYQIHIARDVEFTNTITLQSVTSTQYNHTFSVFGHYYVRVRAISTDSLGPWSAIQWFRSGLGANTLVDEQQLFNAMQSHLTNGITFALFDVTANGILTTLQFSDGAVVTGTIKLVVENSLLRITVESISGGNATQQTTMRDTLPSLIMNVLDEIMPDGYLGIETISMTSSAIGFGVVLPNP